MKTALQQKLLSVWGHGCTQSRSVPRAGAERNEELLPPVVLRKVLFLSCNWKEHQLQYQLTPER